MVIIKGAEFQMQILSRFREAVNVFVLQLNICESIFRMGYHGSAIKTAAIIRDVIFI